MSIGFWIVDTFCKEAFCGIPSAVFFLDDLSDEKLLQNIAMEVNVPESIFLKDLNNGIFDSVCFTPACKGLFFGNALFGAAKVINEKTKLKQFSITCGIRVFAIEILDDTRIKVRFSLVDLEKAPIPANLNSALGGELVVSLAECKDELIVEVRSPSRLQDLHPNTGMLSGMDYNSFAITADTHYETDSDYDFIAKVVAPKLGVHRDVITPIACTKLSAYWKQRVNKSEFIAIGSNGEKVYICQDSDFTYVSGDCIISATGEMFTD